MAPLRGLWIQAVTGQKPKYNRFKLHYRRQPTDADIKALCKSFGELSIHNRGLVSLPPELRNKIYKCTSGTLAFVQDSC